MKKMYGLLGAALALVYACGLGHDVMDVDASQYASISLEMMQRNEWLQVSYRGNDYLDKPPLLFWLSALFFKVLGVSNAAYKAPSLLAAAAGVWGVYRFARLYYTPQTARLAAWMLASSAGLVVVCNDVRTDTLLLAFVSLATWLLAEYLERNQLRHLIGAFVCIGLGMLAKGPIGLVAPALATGTHGLLRGAWRQVFRWQWLLGLLVTALMLMPMCWGLYQQFDLHPAKVVNGRTGVSGLYFYFWEQSFGRITGENVWKNDAGPFYFTHVMLWAFLPWSLLLIPALASALREVFAQRFRLAAGREAYSLGGFMLVFLALSLSRYKLPHYIFVVLPWAAVLSAAWLERAMQGAWLRAVWYAQYAVMALATALALTLAAWVFPTAHPVVWLPALALLILVLAQAWRSPFPADAGILVWRSAAAALAAFWVLNVHFYAVLLPYQSTSAAARYAYERGWADRLVVYNHHGNAMDFYARRTVPIDDQPASLALRAEALGGLWVYGDDQCKEALEAATDLLRVEELVAFQHFQAALLNLRFLNPRTRDKALRSRYLIRVSSAKAH